MSKILDINDARRLFLEGSEALAQVESNGMRIDVDYINRMLDLTKEKCDEIESEMKADPIWSTWKKVYGEGANLWSGPQLAKVLFDQMGVESKSRTATGRQKTDASALEEIDLPFIRNYLKLKKLSDARTKNLMGILAETVNGFLRPHFSLNTTISYRSSSSSPNAQNFPVRDPMLAKLVRRAFIPRANNRVIVEIDLSGAEVRVSACYHQDPTMIDYIKRGHDYHKDLAMQCYMLEADQVTKNVRGTAKGGFVFASFYGDWIVQIAANLWNAIDHDDLKTKDGISLKSHLESRGITELGVLGGEGKNRRPTPGSFMAHIGTIYDNFWNVRFPVYSRWKDEWWNDYLQKGHCTSLTGFTYRGIYERNKIINYPIQGSSFHCLLWSLIQLNRWLNEKKMESLIIGQIHDSIILDVLESELDDVLQKAYRIMLLEIRQEWPWIIVPLDAEAAVGRENWYAKEEVKLAI